MGGFYNNALQCDSIKLVGQAKSLDDNFALEKFRDWAKSVKTPLIAINMGEKGKMSRILNKFLAPVTHPVLPFKAAPGQLSVAEINLGRSLLGDLPAKKFYIFRNPIQYSRSPPSRKPSSRHWVYHITTKCVKARKQEIL